MYCFVFVWFLGTYYIGVEAWTNSTYTILAHFDAQVLLQDGVSQTGSVEKEAVQYYKLHVSDNHNDVTITASPTQGTVYLYVTADHEPDLDDMETVDWYSFHSEGVQSVVIPNTDENFCTDCVYYIAVYGESDAEYVISATTSAQAVRLQSGHNPT